MCIVKIIVYFGIATASCGNSLEYTLGDKHAVLLFVRELEETEPDFLSAAAKLEEEGWSNINLTKAKQISVESLDSIDSWAIDSYQEALSNGFAAIIYSEPV